MTRTAVRALALTAAALTLAACGSAPSTTASSSAAAGGAPAGGGSAHSSPAAPAATGNPGDVVVHTPGVTTDTTIPAATATSAPSPSVVAEPALPLCFPADVTATVSTVPGSAGAGHYDLRLRLTTRRACRITGYPGAQLLAAAKGPALGAPASRTPASPTTVTLDPGGTAVTDLHVTQARSYPACTVRPASHVRVYLPDEREAMTVALPQAVDGCTQGDVALLEVRPFLKG